MAFTVVALGTFNSKGRAFSAAAQTKSIRTASDTDRPDAASVSDARCFVFSSTRTWTIVVAMINL
jgi:hypothetical protein